MGPISSPLKFSFLLLVLAMITESYSQTGNIKYLYTRVNSTIQQRTANEALREILPQHYNKFTIVVNSSISNSVYEDGFEINHDEKNGKIIIGGSTGVAALFGLNYYLKYYCNALVSWEGDQLNLPEVLPKVRVKKMLIDRFRYYQNVCTESYSFLWWDWDRWNREINWMGLNGINLALAFTGQEEIWERVYTKLGLSSQEILDYVSGPAFLAWWRMGNIQKWAGPLSNNYKFGKLVLLRKILKKMRNLGMIPVLPAFSGNVPPGMRKLFPNSTFHQHPNWNNLNKNYSETLMLDPSDPLFMQIGKTFIEQLTHEVGTNHIYNCDAFNENRPISGNLSYLRSVSKQTFKSILAGDPKAVWMMQGWVFTDFNFWKKERVKSFLSGVDIGNIIVLDLQAESLPLYVSTDSFFNHSFIWCMLHNFGGTMNLYGNLQQINQQLPEARKIASTNKTNLIGIGLTPEGINQNSVSYDYFSEMTLYKNPINLTIWMSHYSHRRYGIKLLSTESAWHILLNGVYNNKIPAFRNHGHSILTGRPNIYTSESFWYNPADINEILEILLKEPVNETLKKSQLFQHDLVDFIRQFLVNLGGFIYKDIIEAYNSKNIHSLRNSSLQLLELIDDLEIILGTSEKFLLMKWISDSEKWGYTQEEKAMLRYNSLNQITLWGPNGEIIDYATKQWSGVVSKYYRPRWELFLQTLEKCLKDSTIFNQTDFNERVFYSAESPFTFYDSNYFQNTTKGSSIEEAIRIHSKWKTLYKEGSKFYINNENYYEKDLQEAYGSVKRIQKSLKAVKQNFNIDKF